MSESQPGIIRPPAIFYEQAITNPADQTVAAQKNVTYLTERIEATPNGIMRYNKGMLFPEKGWPTPEAMWNCNIVKRVLMGALLGLLHQYNILPIIGFIFTPWKYKIKSLNKAIIRFNHLCNWILSTVYYKEQVYGPCPKELKKSIYLFLYNLGIAPEEARTFGKIFATLIETDNAYRYRLEDIASETTKEALLENPRKEINRLLLIYLSRESYNPDEQDSMRNFGPGHNFQIFAKILSYALIIPKIRRAFKKTVQEIDLSALQLDEADRYHVLMREQYLFLGRSIKDRYQEWMRIHNGNPPKPIEYSI